jgi:uncharacterized delta-60 repeat protein
MTRRLPRRRFVVSAVSLAAVALALTFGVSGAQAAAGGNDWWEYGPAGAARAVAIQADGKIVAAGVGDPIAPTGNDFMVVRVTTRGALDPSFGKNGKLTTDFGSSVDDAATAVAIQPDGEIVVAGHSNASGSSDFALARYTTSGTLDTSLGTGGMVLTDFGSASRDFATAMAIEPNGKIIVAGYSNAHGTDDFALARYTTNGTLDTSFGTGGKVVTNFRSTSKDEGASVALQPNGRIVVAGSSSRHKLKQFALARYMPSGTLDKSFGSGGKILTGFRESQNSSANGVAIEKNGAIVAAGSTQRAKNYSFALARYTRRGHLDPRFGTDGRVLTRFGSSRYAEADGVAIQADGKIVAAG